MFIKPPKPIQNYLSETETLENNIRKYCEENLPFKEEEFHHIFSREPYSCFSISPMADGSWRCHILTEKYSYHLTKQNTFTHTKAYSKEPTDSWKTVAEINDILSKMFEEQW